MKELDYEMAQRMKRARRAAIKESERKMKRGGAHRNKARYSRKAKFGKDWE